MANLMSFLKRAGETPNKHLPPIVTCITVKMDLMGKYYKEKDFANVTWKRYW